MKTDSAVMWLSHNLACIRRKKKSSRLNKNKELLILFDSGASDCMLKRKFVKERFNGLDPHALLRMTETVHALSLVYSIECIIVSTRVCAISCHSFFFISPTSIPKEGA